MLWHTTLFAKKITKKPTPSHPNALFDTLAVKLKKRILKSADFENPTGEWNTIEIICNGNQTEHYVNGHIVNSGSNASVTSVKFYYNLKVPKCLIKIWN